MVHVLGSPRAQVDLFNLVDGEVHLVEVVRSVDAAEPTAGHVVGLDVLDKVGGPLLQDMVEAEIQQLGEHVVLPKEKSCFTHSVLT